MKNISILFIKLGALMMALSVGFGAFGAHALKEVLDIKMMAIYNTSVEYQFYHSLGLLFIGVISNFVDSSKIKLSGYIMFVSIFLFSGSLYLLTITGIKWLGAITPIGGTGFIIAWILLIFSFGNTKK